MKLNKTTILAGTALASTAVATFFAGSAFAQSTGSQAVEVIIKGGARSTGGLAVQTNQAKDQSIVNKDYISTQIGSSNFAQDINLLPGVNYGNEDPTGVLSSSEFRMHGFDGAHVSITVDGTPVNDTGNYAVYPGEYAVAESTDHITVNLGQTEVDSPTASAIGGTVNIVSKLPETTPSVSASGAVGSYNYERLYGEVQTGALGPTGIRSYLSFNEIKSDKYKGGGDITRWGIDGRVYQPLDNNGFLGVSFTWASNRPYFYFSGSQAQLATYGRDFDYNTKWIPETATPGKADTVPVTPTLAGQPDYQAGAETNYWALHPNPVDFGDIRGQSKFNFGDKATLTVDPYFFYTIANGGGGTNVSECDARLAGSSFGTTGSCGTGKGNGVDLNHDGDTLDTVLLYSPSNTQTHRYGVNSSLIYRFTDTQTLQAAFTYDYGHHRQTGEYDMVNPLNGDPENVFGAKPGYGTWIHAFDGTTFRKRDRLSLAKLNQLSLNYIGRFMDDKLHINVGLRDPHFERDLDERCFVYNGSTEYCMDVTNAAANAAIATDNAAATRTPGAKAAAISALLGVTVNYSSTGAANILAPFKKTYHFTKVLPNVGASYDLNEHNSVYVTYAAGFSAPKTDDLYVSVPELVTPETSDQYGAGWRFKNGPFDLSTNLWAASWNNHIVQSYDPNDPTTSIDRNVGKVKLSGLDVESGWRVTSNFNLYGSLALTHSELVNNYVVGFSTAGVANSYYLPVKGKELVMTPDQTAALRGTYHTGPFSISMQAKYTGKRYVSDMNDASIKGYVAADFDASYKLDGIGKGASIQLNVSNLFGAQYYARVSTVSAAVNTAVANTDPTKAAGTFFSSSPFYYVNAPRTAFITFKGKF